MVLVSYSGREINAKLVYYGPGLSGKTTNLEFIYSSIPQGQRGKMVSMKTKTERTLFFDFLPVHLGELSGFKTRFLLYTVPGQVYYNATRKLVLKGVDAVVFVADSKRGKMDENVESLENLKENLREHGLTLDKLPWVIQYNKRDLTDIYSLEELEAVLNPGRVPSFEGVASTGQGVVETFKGISRLLLRKLARDVGVPVVGASTEQGATAAAPISASAVEPVASRPPAAAPTFSVSPPSPDAGEASAPSHWNLPPVAEPVRIQPFGSHVTLDAARPDREGEPPANHPSVGERLRRWLSRSQGPDEADGELSAAEPSPIRPAYEVECVRPTGEQEPLRPVAETTPPVELREPPRPSPVPEFERFAPFAEIPVPQDPVSEPAAPLVFTSTFPTLTGNFTVREESIDLPEAPVAPVVELGQAPLPAAPLEVISQAALPIAPEVEPSQAGLSVARVVVTSQAASPAAPVVGMTHPASPSLPRRRPREIIVPVELSPDDLAEGVVLKVAIRVRQVAEDFEDEAERYAA